MTVYDGFIHERPQHLALCRQCGCAPFCVKRKGRFMNDVVVSYEGKQVSVPKEVADFLEQDRKQAQAEDRRDRRHLSKSDFETVLSYHVAARRETEDSALRNLQLENLRKAVAALDTQEQRLISLRYNSELSMEEIGQILGVSKMAISKRLKKLHTRLGSSVK
ncbi:MAG: sigma-70 family RNA polymerase sigma factor [Clostridiales bacterium]|jgi:RNA polymerase sigma factor (sigma-70 family)|nr:sigma-70 family RNA polymerase sigma factor [Clostridiales bacterium]